jgi:GAF domain-containing protein
VSLSDSPAQSGQNGSDISERGLLQSVVEVARSVFGAAAASVFLLDTATGDLVFEAVSGEGEEHLVGTRFPSGTGIAGWVATCGQPLLVDDVAGTDQFARDAAEATGYMPTSIMAAPLIRNGECIGVLEVLDRGSRPREDLGDVDLLGLLATEMAMGLELLTRLRWMQADEIQVPGTGARADVSLLRRVAERLPSADEAVARAVTRLLATADDLLANDVGGSG